MATKADPGISSKTSHSILAYSHGAITGYRFFTKEDFLHMMYDMSLEDIMKDLERFKDLEEYEICTKLKFVIREKRKTEEFSLGDLLNH